jgi:hypothetical protein
MRDIDSKNCLACKADFGFITKRRHHCRYCGGLFCHECSDHKPKGVPGYGNEEVRVCDICFYNDMAYLVVYNLMFTGFHTKIFAERNKAAECYAEVPGYASRIFLKMGTGEILEQWACRDTWRHRIAAYATVQVQKHVKPRIPLFWIPTPSQIQQRREMHATLATPAATNPPAPTTIVASMVVFRQNNAEATEHFWAFDAESTAAEALNDAIGEMARIPNLGYGAVLGLDGTVHKLLRTAAAFTAPSQSAFEKTLQTYLSQLSAVCAWHEDGEYRSDYFPTIAQALEFVGVQSESVVMLDCNGSLVLAKNCSRSWREGLAKFAGRVILTRMQLTAVAVCTAHVSRDSRSSTTVRVFDNFYQAQKLLIAEQTSALFGMPMRQPGDSNGFAPSVVFLRRNPHLPKDVALSLAAEAAAVCQPHLPATSSSQSGQDEDGAPVHSTAAGATAPVASMPECQICFIAFNPGPNKPCLCGACGNSVCYTCIRSMTQCAFCRKGIDPSAPIITNVQLLQLVSGVTD